MDGFRGTHRRTLPIGRALLAVGGLLLAEAAGAEPRSITGSRMALSAAEAEALQQQISFDFQAAIDAKDRCDEEAFERVMATLLAKLRYANASTTEMVHLAGEMASAIAQMAEELRDLLPEGTGGGALALIARVGVVGAGAVPVVGAAIGAVEELAEVVSEDAARASASDVLRRVLDQLAELHSVQVNAERWRALHDEIAEVIERAQAYRWGPCFGPGDAPPGADDAAGGDVSKQDLTTLGGAVDPVRTTMVRIPPDESQDATVVAEDDEIDSESEYIVAAECHRPRLVAGRDLVREREARLENRRRVFRVEPCDSIDAALRQVAVLHAIAGRIADEHTVFAASMDDGVCLVSVDVSTFVLAFPPPGCTPRGDQIADSGLDGANDGVNPASDDPGVDDTAPQPVDPDDPVIETNRKSKIALPRQAQVADDPLFQSLGGWDQPYRDQWGLHRIGFAPTDGAALSALWPPRAEPVVVAVVDTGVDRTHPELVGSLWFNEREIPGNGLDDDANGYVDDLHGWNFLDGNDDVRDLNGHGTVIAGILAAWTGNGRGIAGVNPWVRIMPLKVASWNGEAWNFDIAAAVRYAADNGARVINISLAGDRLRRSEHVAVAYARSKGVIVVAAAGNDSVDVAAVSPAGLPGVVTVAASDPGDRRARFSNWGAGVDIVAPGVDILSLRARQTDLLALERADYVRGTAIVGEDRRYYRLTGTSFAAPLVSGVASLLLSLRPELDDMQVMRMLLHSARDLETPGWDQYTGYGLLDAAAALRARPDYYLLSRISAVTGAKTSAGFALQVTGRAMANAFGSAWIEIGRGDAPSAWERASEVLTRPVDEGLLTSIPASRFAGGKEWTLRLVVVHADGSRREARFKLVVG